MTPPLRGIAEKGSQRWLQIAVNHAPHLLDSQLEHKLPPSAGAVEWFSPRADDNPPYCEYRDDACFTKLGIKLTQRPRNSFWPNRGPVWDALGRSTSGELLLVEAKAHIAELVSPSSRAGKSAASQIAKSLEEARKALAPKASISWSETFYQYANRLAHLYLVRELNNHPAHLVFIYFLNADDVGGPATTEEWMGAIKVVETYLGIGTHRLSRFVHKLFVDVNELRLLEPTPR